MKDIAPQRFFDALDATWAPQEFQKSSPFKMRVGNGGGKRVSAATLEEDSFNIKDIETISQDMLALGQDPLFMLKPGQEDFDQTLDKKGFSLVDPVTLYAIPAETLSKQVEPGLTSIPCALPLAAQKEIWALDDIGPARIEVMERSASPKTYLLGRHEDRIAGTVFVSCDREIAMLHALVVHPRARRQGMAKRLTLACAKWAKGQGADILALMATRENKPACALYESLGMTAVSHYHYRIKTE